MVQTCGNTSGAISKYNYTACKLYKTVPFVENILSVGFCLMLVSGLTHHSSTNSFLLSAGCLFDLSPVFVEDCFALTLTL